MSELEGFSYAVFAVYATTSAGLMAAGARLGVIRRPVWPLIAFSGAGLWPLLRLFVGDPVSPDPLQQQLDGLSGDLLGHALLAIGALTAMMAEVQILTRARMAAQSIAEDHAGPLTGKLVAGGRVLQLLGLFLVFPGMVLGGLTLMACPVVFGARA